jgi:hypothetical protein
MRWEEDARAAELDLLKLALATFALQLDVFEMRAHQVLLTVGKPVNSGLLPDADCLSDGDWRRKDDVIGDQ